jgi:hypothetical protein
MHKLTLSDTAPIEAVATTAMAKLISEVARIPERTELRISLCPLASPTNYRYDSLRQRTIGTFAKPKRTRKRRQSYEFGYNDLRQTWSTRRRLQGSFSGPMPPISPHPEEMLHAVHVEVVHAVEVTKRTSATSHAKGPAARKETRLTIWWHSRFGTMHLIGRGAKVSAPAGQARKSSRL